MRVSDVLVDRRAGVTAFLVALGAAGLCGCTGPGASDAGLAAVSFEQLAPDDAAKACDLLSGHTRDDLEKQSKKACTEALGEADLPDPSALQSVEVFGHDARVLLGSDTVFLARYQEGWKVTAAGCKPGSSDDEPYDCELGGG